ncbi:MAG: [FeFe] hydrogenase H-cluster radical SAM maturase HydG [Candidatus Gygaella obscura]|nr:[FeFe] hydrogenase H-cluster radical SAM maturase HydG [Candidatus Gygaella obscura]
MKTINIDNWIKQRIKQNQIDKYLNNGKDFIDDDKLNSLLAKNNRPDNKLIEDIIAKSLEINTLSLEEVACLLNVEDDNLLEKMKQACKRIKKNVYDNRIVTFAPLYLGNFCVNDCLYCGFKRSNLQAKRRVLSVEEIKREVKVLAGKIGHKRLIVVYGEDPRQGIDYMMQSIKAIYSVQEKTKHGVGSIRRVNVNASPLSVEELQKLKEVGIGTYQVFQETYHHDTYKKVHPINTIKGNYAWRLYCMHRAFEAGVDDVGLGVLFGLYDWRFEVLGLCAHNIELEKRFNIGAHTISFPRLEPAHNAPLTLKSQFKVNDRDFKKLIMVIRLAVPYTGMIITARENALIREEAVELGITQTDASTKIGIGAYSENKDIQEDDRQQFILGDTRSLDELIRSFAKKGHITSFCTAGYRCGRTGKCIMELLKSGAEGKFCKLNAILTFREWLDDFASEETKKVAEPVIEKEINEVKKSMPKVFTQFMDYYGRIKQGERDLYF